MSGSDSDAEEENFCLSCGKEYQEDEDWIACDECKHWFHRQCGGLKSVKSWNYFKSRYRKSRCQDCKVKNKFGASCAMCDNTLDLLKK